MTFRVTRRALLAGALAAPAWPAAARTCRSVSILSPAPSGTSLDLLNRRLADLAARYPSLRGLSVPAIALPQSINGLAALPAAERAQHWPIVTTLDLALARRGAGPEWHHYARVNRDLKFVSCLCNTGFGIATWGEPLRDPAQLRGKRIAVPPRTSAVRLMTETLLRDGWNMLDAVELIAMPPTQVPAARAGGRIDATSWSIVGTTPAGHRPTLPPNPADPLHYMPVDAAALARINAANPFVLRLSPLLDGAPPLLSFAQGLAAWDDSDPRQIADMLDLLARHGGTIPGFARSVAAMADWPGLTPDATHPVAARFYRAHRRG